MPAEKISQVGFLAEDESGKPKAGLQIQAPAIKVEVVAIDSAHGRVDAVETNNRVVLILRPHATLEPSAAGFRKRSDVEHDALDVAEEFGAHVVELIVLAIESVRVEVNHLQEALGNEIRLEQAAHVIERIEFIHACLFSWSASSCRRRL